MINGWKKIEVSINKKETECYVTVPFLHDPGASTLSLTVKDLRKALQQAGVTKGINQETLEGIFAGSYFGEAMLVAEEIPPTDGKDASIEYFFEAESKLNLEEDLDGKIDYKNVSILTNKKKGDKLCRLTPPTPGRSGWSVKGKKIEPKSGNLRKLPKGQNTEISDYDDNILVAATDGCVMLSQGGLVEMLQNMVIDGDVDFSTGNIEYNGSMKIRGNVKSGFKVNVAGDLEIEGCVEDAEVEAGGNVLVKKGFVGTGNGVIRAGGDVHVKFVQNQEIICKGDLLIGEELLHSTVLVGGKLTVKGRKGKIFGGQSTVQKSVEAHQIGNIQYAATEISVGSNFKQLSRITEIKKELEQIKVNREKIGRGLQNLKRLKIRFGRNLAAEQQAIFDKLTEAEKAYPAHVKQLEDETERLGHDIGKQNESNYVSFTYLFPGVKINIGRYAKIFNEKINQKVLRLVKGNIQAVV